MIQRIRIWNAEIYPIPQWVNVMRMFEEHLLCEYGYTDDDIYFYHEFDEPIKQWDYVTFDEDFLVVEVSEE